VKNAVVKGNGISDEDESTYVISTIRRLE